MCKRSNFNGVEKNIVCQLGVTQLSVNIVKAGQAILYIQATNYSK